jgi:hypothetical protein
VTPSDWIAIAAVTVSGVTVLASLAGIKISTEGQRNIAADERLWQRRADTYVDLLGWCHDAAAKIDNTERRYDSLAFAVPPDLQARALAFASPYVKNQLQVIEAFHVARMQKRMVTNRSMEEIREDIDLFQEMRLMVWRLSLSIREDLGSDKAATNEPPT